MSRGRDRGNLTFGASRFAWKDYAAANSEVKIVKAADPEKLKTLKVSHPPRTQSKRRLDSFYFWGNI